MPLCPLKRVSLWDKVLQFNPDVYILLRGLDKETLTNVFLSEALADLAALLSEDLLCSGIFVYQLYILYGRDITA